MKQKLSFLFNVKAYTTLILAACAFNLSAQNFENLIDKGFNFMLNSEYVYNKWEPNESYCLNYYTEGIQYYKFEAKLSHDLEVLPELKFSWETNFNAKNQDELLRVHNSISPLENAYNKIMFVAGFGKSDDDFNPYRSNSIFDLSYSKETFFISVTPTTDYLYYAPFNSSGDVSLSEGENLDMFTKFEEIQGTFRTGGFAVLPFLISSFCGGDVIEIMSVKGMDTRLGVYYATFQKPFMVNQVYSSGYTSGDYNYIYNARFNSYGLVEKYGYYGKVFLLDMQLNFGLAQIKLRNDSRLEDSESPLFFHCKMRTNMGFHIPIANAKVNLSLLGSLDWSFMYGGTYNSETQHIESKSYLNDDTIFKVYAALTVNL